MNDNILYEEITRIFEIMGNEHGVLIAESNLLVENEITLLRKLERNVSKWIEGGGAAERALERFLVQDGRPFEQRLTSWIESLIKKGKLEKSDKAIIADFFSTGARASEKFRKNYVNSQKTRWERIMNSGRGSQLERFVKTNFGDETWAEFERTRGNVNPKPNIKPKPNPNPVNKKTNYPDELKTEEDVKQFQDWLNDNYPGWNASSADGKVAKNSRGYGKFGKNTKAAWDFHKKEYIEKYLTIPDDLKKPGFIGHFQDWLDSKKKGWTKATKEGRLNRESKDGYGQWNQETSEAWSQYGKEWKESLSIAQEIGKVDVPAVETQDISIIERFFAGKYTVTGEIRPFLYNVIQPLIIAFVKKLVRIFNKKYQGRTREEVIDTIIGNFKLALEKCGQSLQKGQVYADVTLLRKIMMDIRLLQENIDVNVIVDEIVTLMKQNESRLTIKERAALDEVIKAMRANDPMTTGSKSWFLDFLKNTSWGVALRGIFDKQISGAQKFKNLIERTFFFGVAGTPKKWGEIKAYWEQYGTGPGLLILGRDVWVAAKIGFPIFLAMTQTLINGLRNLITGSGEKFDGSKWGFVEFLERNYIAMMTGSDGNIGVWSTIWGTVWPLHFYAQGWYRFITDYDRAIQRKDVLPLMKQIDDIFRKSERAIENTMLGFVAWSKKNNVQLLSGDTHPEIYWIKETNSKDGRPFGRGQNGKNYVYNPSTLTFVECTDCGMKEAPVYDPNIIDKVDSLKVKAEKEYDEKIGPTQAGFLIWASKHPDDVGNFNPVKDIVSFVDSSSNSGLGSPTHIQLSNDRYFMWNSQTKQWEKY